MLVVDDDLALAEMLGIVLRNEGLEVSHVADGGSALVAFRDTRPDLVLLDVMMPGLDGHEVLARIRAADGGATLPVVMLTAAADDANAWRAWTEGVDYFLSKPFDPDELLRYLHYLFAGAASA